MEVVSLSVFVSLSVLGVSESYSHGVFFVDSWKGKNREFCSFMKLYQKF